MISKLFCLGLISLCVYGSVSDSFALSLKNEDLFYIKNSILENSNLSNTLINNVDFSIPNIHVNDVNSSNCKQCDSSLLSIQNGFADIVERLSPAVVNISTEQKIKINQNRFKQGLPNGDLFEEFREFFERFDPFLEHNAPDAEKEVVSLGSGFIIDESGIIVTNYHVISNADEIKITLVNNEQYIAKVLGYDLRTDLAVLKIQTPQKLPYVEFGASEKARVGDWVVAIGNPFGLGGSVSVGVISARGRDIAISHSSGDFIQTDAAINRGNSGGPLFDVHGKVIGINAAIYSPSGGNVGIGFAVPSDIAYPVISSLVKGEEIKRGWIGVTIQEITNDIAESFGGGIKGALIAGIAKDSPAEKSGMKIGDIIVEFNKTEIDNSKKLVRAVSAAKIDSVAEVVVVRIGPDKKQKRHILNIKIDKLKEGPSQNQQNSLNEKKYDDLGITISNIMKSNNKDSSEERGVIVVAAKLGGFFRKGDIILSIANVDVNNVDDFDKMIEKERKANSKSVLLFIKRGGLGSFISVKLK